MADAGGDLSRPTGVYRGSRSDVERPVLPSALSLDSLALFAIFLQTTELYRPLGYLAGLSSSLQVNVLFLALMVFYLVARNETLVHLHSGLTVLWIGTLLVVPTIIMSLQLLDDSLTVGRLVYWSAFSSTFTVVLVGAAVLWSRWGQKLIKPFFLACLAGAWLGFAVNWFAYDFIRQVMGFSSNPKAATEYLARTIGFYGHSNVAAFSIVLYFTCLACNRAFLESRLLLQAVVSTASVVGVVITGSRTSLVLVAIVTIWYVRNLLSVHRDSSQGTRRQVMLAPLIPFAVIAMALLVLQVLASTRQEMADVLTSRIGSIADLATGGGTDTSAELRASILPYYFSDILESPLLGQGPDFAISQIEIGNYGSGSQNAWLEWSIRFGIPYAFLVLASIYFTYRITAKVFARDHIPLSFSRLSMILIFLITFSIASPLWIRSTVCVLGVLIGVALYSRADSTHEASSGAYSTGA